MRVHHTRPCVTRQLALPCRPSLPVARMTTIDPVLSGPRLTKSYTGNPFSFTHSFFLSFIIKQENENESVIPPLFLFLTLSIATQCLTATIALIGLDANLHTNHSRLKKIWHRFLVMATILFHRCVYHLDLFKQLFILNLGDNYK